MAIEINTSVKSMKSIKEHFKNNGVFYSSLDLAEKLKSYITFPVAEVYDPTCGAGSLLSVFGDDVKKYGQELDKNQACYAQKTLINAEIMSGDTLVSPAFYNHKFKAIVANPPFSVKWLPNLLDERFMCAPALAPRSKADYAFILHCLHYLSNDGLAVILCPHGVLFRGGAERDIRKWLIEQNYIDRLVCFCGDFFEDTKLPTVAIILNKHKITTGIYFEDTNLKLGRQVSAEEIKENDFNLNFGRYIQEPIVNVVYDYEKEFVEISQTMKEVLIADLEFHRMASELECGGNYLSNYKKYINELRAILNDAENKT